MAVAHNALTAILSLEVRVFGEKIRDLAFYRLRQQGARTLPENFCELILKRSWLNHFDHVIVGHGISLLRWGEVEASSTPTICRPPDSRRHQLSAIARFF